MIGYIFTLPVNLFLTLFNYLFCWLIACSVDANWNLTGPFKSFQTTDALMNGKGTLPGGEGGDVGFYNRHLPHSKTLLGRWWTTVCWLCRNPTNGFDEGIFGQFPISTSLKYIGDANMEHWPEDGRRYLFRLTHQGKGSWFNQPWEIYFKFHVFKGYGPRIRLGWKLSSFLEGYYTTGHVAQYVFVPHPFTKIKKI